MILNYTTYLPTYLPTSIEQSPYWESNIHSTSEYILRLLLKRKFHYGVHKSPNPEFLCNIS